MLLIKKIVVLGAVSLMCTAPLSAKGFSSYSLQIETDSSAYTIGLVGFSGQLASTGNEELLVDSINMLEFEEIEEPTADPQIEIVRSPFQDSEETARITERPLAYPSPIRSSNSESGIYYALSNAMNIQLKVYDIRGNLVYQRSASAGAEGAQLGRNKMALTTAIMGFPLQAGTYFFLLISDGKIVGKGRFGALP
jgi:hypothetical protein